MTIVRLILFVCGMALAAGPLKFREHTIATDLKGGYQVVVCDVNRDGKPDLIALGSGMDELVWFENPGWERHVLVRGLPQMINLACAEGEIVIAYGFSMQAEKSTGVVAVLRNGVPAEIDRLPTSHRIRWADIDGSGKKVAINAPLIGAKALAPEYREHVPLVFYRPGEWKRESIGNAEEGVVHGITVVDWDHNGREGILAAGFTGIHLYRYGRDGKWTRTEIARGNPEAWPKSGSSDVAVGKLGKERFLAAIEPWHGNQAVVYREAKGEWRRETIDDSLVDGHTILTADFDGDGRDEIIAGFRGGKRGVYVYRLENGRWEKQVLDEGSVSAAGCAVADLDGDGRVDIACIGSATQNLKWYQNVSEKAARR
ncbi:MAG: VCBS repeat-containing protein [Acidobacteriota bacterium]|nr:VCBS repeat-containing protein [Acidobacteriota bacterium]